MSDVDRGEGASASLEALAAAMLDASEAIHRSLLGSGDLDELLPAFEARERSFESFRAAVEDGVRLDAASRTCLARIAQLDHEILALGQAQGEAMRDERQGLLQRRAAVKAHTQRERAAARVIKVKA